MWNVNCNVVRRDSDAACSVFKAFRCSSVSSHSFHFSGWFCSVLTAITRLVVHLTDQRTRPHVLLYLKLNISDRINVHDEFIYVHFYLFSTLFLTTCLKMQMN